MTIKNIHFRVVHANIKKFNWSISDMTEAASVQISSVLLLHLIGVGHPIYYFSHQLILDVRARIALFVERWLDAFRVLTKLNQYALQNLTGLIQRQAKILISRARGSWQNASISNPIKNANTFASIRIEWDLQIE